MSRNYADRTDVALLRAMNQDPRVSMLALAERTGLARNTVRARLERYEETGTLHAFERRVDPAFLGYPLRAAIFTEVTQRKLAAVAAALAAIPEVLEVVGLSGVTDLLVQVAARDADDLYRVAGQILDIDGVVRTNTALVMRELVDYRTLQLANP